MSTRDDLIQQHAGLAIAAARRYYHIYPRADLDQAAMLGLVRAARTYEPDRVPNVKFSTYAMRCILTEIKALVRGQLKGDGMPADNLEDTAESVDRLMERAELYGQLARAVGMLTLVEEIVMRERLGLGGHAPVSQLELSAATGVGLDRIRAIEKAAMAKLRASIDDER